jgi:DNA-binding NarL/FixJ family response regulator
VRNHSSVVHQKELLTPKAIIMAESNQPTDNKTYLEVLEMLSPREVEVLKLVGKGLMNKEIADELYLSVRTIHSHRRKICSKLNF